MEVKLTYLFTLCSLVPWFLLIVSDLLDSQAPGGAMAEPWCVSTHKTVYEIMFWKGKSR